MNEELQNALATILNKTIEATGQATAFLESEIPEVIQQLLAWKLTMNAIIFLVAVGIYFAAAKTLRYTKSIKPEDGGKGNLFWSISPYGLDRGAASLSEFSCIFGVIGMGALVVVALAGMDGLLTSVQILIAPKVYLIEYAASLTNG
jgi:hypothetical protein